MIQVLAGAEILRLLYALADPELQKREGGKFLPNPTSASANQNFLPNDFFRHFPKKILHFPNKKFDLSP